VFHVAIWGAWSFVWGAKPTKAPPWRWDCCKRLGLVIITLSIKPYLSLLIFSRVYAHHTFIRQVDRHVDTTIGEFTKVRIPHRLWKIEQWIMKNRRSKCSFALSTYLEVRNETLTTYSHRPARTYYNKPLTFYCVKSSGITQGSANTGSRPGVSPWRNWYRAVRNQGQIGPKLTGTTDIRTHCGCHWLL